MKTFEIRSLWDLLAKLTLQFRVLPGSGLGILITVSPRYRSPKRDYYLPNRDRSIWERSLIIVVAGYISLAEERNYGL